jgi:hypothetical protein
MSVWFPCPPVCPGGPGGPIPVSSISVAGWIVAVIVAVVAVRQVVHRRATVGHSRATGWAPGLMASEDRTSREDGPTSRSDSFTSQRAGLPLTMGGHSGSPIDPTDSA